MAHESRVSVIRDFRPVVLSARWCFFMMYAMVWNIFRDFTRM